jgi:hypothetical protein
VLFDSRENNIKSIYPLFRFLKPCTFDRLLQFCLDCRFVVQLNVSNCFWHIRWLSCNVVDIKTWLYCLGQVDDRLSHVLFHRCSWLARPISYLII